MQKKVALACEKCGSRNYTVDHTQAQTERLELKKFCRHCNAHTVHRETK
ncbi:MAG: 50S ribosomal protein L33 [Heyndrickxia sp.]